MMMRALLSGMLAFAPIGLTEAAEPKPAHGFAMHGDVKYGPDFEHFDYVRPDAPKGGKVTLAALGSFDSFNPYITKGNPASGLGFIYDSLMSASSDEAFSQYGRLAESLIVPEDRSWVEYTLREEARWHDGEPVTPDDVVWTFNTLIEKGQPFWVFYYRDVKKVEKTGARTVRFSFNTESRNRELPLIVGQMQILPKHYWETRDFSKTTLEPPLGSGPYKIKSFEPGRTIIYERVPDYWGADIPVSKGVYNFDVIQYDYYRDGNVAIEAFIAGRYDYRAENSSKAWATAYDTPAFKAGVLKKEEIRHNRPSGMQGFVYNLRRAKFQAPAVREALAYAFNFEWSNKALFYGQYKRSRSFFENSEMAAAGLPGDEELKLLNPVKAHLPPEVFTAEYQPPTGDESGKIRKNLRKASKLLRDAGWVIKDGKRVNAKTGESLDFEVLLVSPLFERVVLPFKENLKVLGVDVTVRTIDPAQYRQRVRTFDYDMVVGGWPQSTSPGNEQRDFWTSDAKKREGSRNLAGIDNPGVDALVESLIAAPDRKSLVVASRALDRALQWGHYVIPHFHAGYDRIAYWDKFGRPAVTPQQGNQFAAWWIEPDREATLDERKKVNKK